MSRASPALSKPCTRIVITPCGMTRRGKEVFTRSKTNNTSLLNASIPCSLHRSLSSFLHVFRKEILLQLWATNFLYSYVGYQMEKLITPPGMIWLAVQINTVVVEGKRHESASCSLPCSFFDSRVRPCFICGYMSLTSRPWMARANLPLGRWYGHMSSWKKYWMEILANIRTLSGKADYTLWHDVAGHS